ncbi:E3 ubiquitin-protein ligase SINA-like 7, partial [Triticum aestivum]
CSEGHILSRSCHNKILDKKCHECCIETSFKRCAIMEHVVQSVAVPCCNAKYGCREGLAYYQKERHEQVCPTAPCFCPIPGCSYVVLIPLLLDHLTFKHSCPSTVLQDFDTLSLRFKPGLHVLQRRSRRTNYIFLLNMDSEPFGYAISVVCVQPKVTQPKFTCSLNYDYSMTGYCESSSFQVRSSSLSDGLLTGPDLILLMEKISDDRNGIMLKTTIQREACSGDSYYSNDDDYDDDDDDDDDEHDVDHDHARLLMIRHALEAQK